MFFEKKQKYAVSMNRAEETVGSFGNGANCAQAIVSVYGSEFGLEREIALKISAPFGSGMGMGETCGAVTGALMVIGLKYARVLGIKLSKEKAARVSREFIQDFKARHGSVSCRELLGCDLTTPEGFALAEEEKYFKKRCPGFVGDATEILEKLLEKS